jgi:hypothetical protein
MPFRFIVELVMHNTKFGFLWAVFLRILTPFGSRLKSLKINGLETFYFHGVDLGELTHHWAPRTVGLLLPVAEIIFHILLAGDTVIPSSTTSWIIIESLLAF